MIPLEIDGVDKRLGTRQVLRGVSLCAAAGDVLLVLGENGSGKSTLLRLCSAILEPDRGEVRVAGRPVRDPAARRALAYVPDTGDALPDLRAGEFLGLLAALKGTAPLSAALAERLGIAAFLGQRLLTLSFGQRKRVYLAGALLGAPSLWLLDEPSSGLDPAGVSLLCELLRERRQAGGATLLCTNDPEFAACLCQDGARACRLVDGALIAHADG